MKNQFSKVWKSSKQPRKQKKYLAKAPLHIRKNFLNINLSKELRNKHGKRNIQAKQGDTVRVTKGKFKGKTGKIQSVDLKRTLLTVENVQVKKQDGSNANVKMRPSNLQITELGERPQKMGEQKNTSEKSSSEKPKSTKKASSNKQAEAKQGDK